MIDLYDMFNIEGLEPADSHSDTAEDALLGRVYTLRLHIAGTFGQAAMYNHPFMNTKLSQYEGKTPHKLACESEEGLYKAIHALKSVPRG